MSRRKQAFPVRVEGNILHLSVESGPSCTQNSSEPTSDKTLPDKCDLDIPDEEVNNKSQNVSNGEFIVSSAVPQTSVLSFEESKTSGFVHDEQNFIESETKEQDSILSSVGVESLVVLEDDSTVTSTFSDSSFCGKEESCCTVKEELHAFHVDERKKNLAAVSTLEPKYVHQPHRDDSCKEIGKSADICRDLNIRTSLVCKAGTEIKIIQNTCAEKVEVQCVTDPTEITFEIHKKTQNHTGRSRENDAPVIIDEVCSELEDLESKDTVLCAQTDDIKSEPLIICMDSFPDDKESSVCTSPIDERKQCERVVSSPEPDSSTILLDESELNIPDEDVSVGSSRILPDAELIVCDDIYNEPNTGALADEEALPPIKVEPCIILKEEKEPLNIPSCTDTSGVAKDESLITFPDDELKQSAGVINIEESRPPFLPHSHAQHGCKSSTNSPEPCNDSNVRSPLTRRVTRQSARAEKEVVQRLTELTNNTCKDAKKQLENVTGSLNKDCTLGTEEPRHTCSEPKNILGSEDPPLEAILPCVDIDLSLLKEEHEPVVISSHKSPIPIIEENALGCFPDEEIVINTSPLSLSCDVAQYGPKSCESSVEECRNLNVKTRPCRTRNKANQSIGAETEDHSRTKSKGNTAKAGRKRRLKTRGSRRKISVSQTKGQNQGCTDPEESQLQAILPCVDVDPSLLKAETEPVIISGCKDAISVSSETNFFVLPGDEGKQVECKANTQLICQGHREKSEISEDSTSTLESDIPGNKSSRLVKPCVTDEEIRCMVDFTKEALEQREKKLQQIREAVYRKRSLETDEQRQARLEKDKLRQRKRRAEETEEQREKRLLTMRLHKRIKRSMNSSAGLQKNFLDYYMEEMFKYPETQEEQGSPLNMIVSIDPSWVVRTVEKQQFRCTVETEEQRRTRLEKDMLRQRKKRAEETAEQRAKRLETMRINKRIRRAMETEEQRLRRLEYSRQRQLFRRLNETEEQRRERLEREKLRQREKRASESAEERALRLHAARERMRTRLSDPSKVSDMIDNLLSSDSLSS